MITQNEISSLNLSPTKKDFVQIWNELIEVASKITERWDPTSTNESDPGIVLLKVLTGIADKLNYNIDKNILEAYMPTAAQMESMRKLCELAGYDIKYYQSAETKVRISYTGNTEDDDEKLPTGGLELPKFTAITNADKDITFVTTNETPALITNTTPWVEVPCIEGQISQCESTNENNLITLAQLDNSNRYYLPEIQIAENGIFVYNAATAGTNLIDRLPWEQVSNLNTQPPESRVFKFGYDSFEGRPYIAFPADAGSLIGDGLFIYFVRTSGLSGNISARKLEVLELPTGKEWSDYSAEQFEVVNFDATTNGANIESISAAYNNFKKTVGTFDTLVTCRDYMNKIYSLMDASNSPYVSNILVTDIRNDINKSITLCSCNEFGILYKETPLIKSTTHEGTSIKTVESDAKANVYKLIVSSETVKEEPKIDHFDLILYPFKTFTQVSSGTKDLVSPYNRSFTYTEGMKREIEASLEEFKTCAHNLKTPDEGDIVSINNYLRLNALIATSTRVSEIEAEAIIKNVKVALVNEFNLRNLDFGEEIPFDNILSVIENADSRIKVVSLQEPAILTTYSIKEHDDGDVITSKEYGIASVVDDTIVDVDYEYDKETKTYKCTTAKEIYNKLMLRNILAGRASLFDYDETFISNNAEKPYTITHAVMQSINDLLNDPKVDASRKEAAEACRDLITDAIADILDKNMDENGYIPGEYILPIRGLYDGVVTLKVFDTETYKVYETYEPYKCIIDNIARVEASREISSVSSTFTDITLAKNEVIKFRAPNLITTKTFPAYVYYHFERGNSSTSEGSYAEAMALNDFINKVGEDAFFTKLWDNNNSSLETFSVTLTKSATGQNYNQADRLPNIFNTALAVGYIPEGASTYTICRTTSIFEQCMETELAALTEGDTKSLTFVYYPLSYGTISDWGNCIKALDSSLPNIDNTILWKLSSTSSFSRGKLVTRTGKRLSEQDGDTLTTGNVGEITFICTDSGSDPVFDSIPENSDVALGVNDKLYIHYTPSSTNEDGETVNAEPVSIVYEGGDLENPIIIRPSGFTLIPSNDVNKQGTSWKKTGVDFGKYGTQNLLALAPNEQIELRSISRVVLDKPARFYKNFENARLEQGDINNIIEYELKDGEYIFYTDQNNTEAAYYGSGSVITLGKGAKIPKAREQIEVSQILEQGLHIIPWSDVVLLSSNRKITVTEYQYRTLVEGDTLDTLTIDAEPTAGKYLLGGRQAEWTKCISTAVNPIKYTVSGADNSEQLNMIDLATGPHTSWEVCSFLELSTAPGYSQQLRAVERADGISIMDRMTIYKDVATGVAEEVSLLPIKTVLIGADGTETYEYEPVSVKLSMIAQAASGNFEKPKQNSDSEEINQTNLQIKIFKEQVPSLITVDNLDDVITPISAKDSEPAELNNVNNYWSALEIAGKLVPKATDDDTSQSVEAQNKKALKLNFTIPENDVFGIFSIYLEVTEDKVDKASIHRLPKEGARVFIDLPKEFGSYDNVINIFNYQENGRYWWFDGVGTWQPEAAGNSNLNRLYLRAGLNCIQIKQSCNILIKAENNATGSIIYDNMRLVKGVNTHGINLSLLDPNAVGNSWLENASDIDKKALAESLLANIEILDKNREFYYNVPIENSLAIEFDNNISSFSNPYTLYDINNINNDFVISKLDVKYLDTGLKIAKSSKY